MALHPFLAGTLLAVSYHLAQHILGEPQVMCGLRGGVRFAILVFVVGVVPVYALNYASFVVSGSVMLSWIVHSGCQYLAAGVALGLTVRTMR
jgi:hypothetical protein